MILDIDLTNGAISTRSFSEALVRECLGGFGFNTRYLYKHLAPETGPYGPDNILVLSLGLLTGTAAPSSSRVHISARSPLSGFMASSSVGGFLGVRLRMLGIAALVIRGRASRPVYLEINEDGPAIEDGTELWGLDTRETDAALREKPGNAKAETLTIGPGGEHLVRYACIMAGTDHAAGRTGLGAVMGSKNLKAICIACERKPAKPSPEVLNITKEYIRSIKASASRYEDYSERGSAGDIIEINEMGVLGTRNYRGSFLEGAERIDGRAYAPYITRKTSCYRCPVHCKAEVELKAGKHQGFTGGRPEYETVIGIGSLCGLDDPEAVVYLSNLSNILGLDTISTGSVIAFAMDLYDRGIITAEDTGGIDLQWGDAEAMEKMMYRIASRKGFGDVLAEGVLRASEKIGRGAEQYAYHVKGVEIYGADPRGMMGTALAYAVSLRGGDFTSVYPVPEFRYTAERAEKEFGTKKAVDLAATEGKGALVRYSMIVSAVIDSLGICKVPALSIAGHFDLTREAALVNALTEFEFDVPELLSIGERIINMEKLFNLRFGAVAGDDTLPETFLKKPIEAGPSRGGRVDLKPMVRDFYEAMGWDEKGIPTGKTLERLGLDPEFYRLNKKDSQ